MLREAARGLTSIAPRRDLQHLRADAGWQIRPERAEPGSQARQLLEVCGSEQLDAPRPLRGELEPGDALIGFVREPLHQSAVRGPVHQFDDAVVTEQQVVGDLTDRWRVAMAPDGEQELVLGGGETRGVGLLLAPPLEPAQSVAEVEEPVVVVIGQR